MITTALASSDHLVMKCPLQRFCAFANCTWLNVQVLPFFSMHLQVYFYLTAAEKPECAIKTLAFMVELVEAGIIPAEVLWDFLSACLEGLTEDKTDQLNVMLTLASSKQGACATWDRVLELMQSRLEAVQGL